MINAIEKVNHQVTYQYSEDHPEDLFEFLEYHQQELGKPRLAPWGCRFANAGLPYTKQVIVDIYEDEGFEVKSYEVSYSDIADLNKKIDQLTIKTV